MGRLQTHLIAGLLGVILGLCLAVWGGRQFWSGSAEESPPPEGDFFLRLAGRQTYGVLQVMDGDTVQLENGLVVRLAGIDAPETRRFVRCESPYAQQAVERLRGLVEGREVRLVFGPRKLDRHGRLLADLELLAAGEEAAPVSVGATLVAEGLARALSSPDAPQYLADVERSAQEARRGMWSLTEADAAKTRAECPYVASASSEVFHESASPAAGTIRPWNLIGFPSREAALMSGRRPAKH